MSIKLEILAAMNSIDDLETIIHQTEELDFRLLSISMGETNNQPGNILTLRRESVGPNEGVVRLEVIDRHLTLDQQEEKINELEGNGKKLIGYWSIYVQSFAQNVAAYRS